MLGLKRRVGVLGHQEDLLKSLEIFFCQLLHDILIAPKKHSTIFPPLLVRLFFFFISIWLRSFVPHLDIRGFFPPLLSFAKCPVETYLRKQTFCVSSYRSRIEWGERARALAWPRFLPAQEI